MQAALRLQTKVLPGHRIELSAPELPEGDTVEVIVVLPEPAAAPARLTMMQIIESLPPGPRSASTWEELERELRQERDAWDR